MSSSSGSSSASGSGSSSSSGSASGSSSARDGSSSARDGSSAAPLTSARTEVSGAAPPRRGEGSWSAPVIVEGGGRGHQPATSATGGPPPSYPAPGALQLAREQRKALQKKVLQFTREELSGLTRHSAFEIATQNETTTKHFRKRLYLESAYKPGTELPEDVTALSLRLLRDVTTVGKAMTLLNLERSLFTLRLKGRQSQQSQKDYEKHHIRFSRMKPGVTYLDFVRVVKAELGYSTEEAELLFWDVLNPERIADTELLFWLKLENHKPLAFTGTEKAPADEDEDKASKPLHQVNACSRFQLDVSAADPATGEPNRWKRENEALLSELCAETVPKVFLTRDRFRRYLECTERRVRDAERRRFRFDYKDVDGLLDRFVFLYGSLLCAWRVLFDPGCSGAPVPWATFRKKLADHSECNARLLWNFLAPFESSQLSAEQSRIYSTNVVEENPKATAANANHQEHYRRPQQSLLLQLRDFDLDGYLLIQDLGRAVFKLHLTPELCWYEYDLNQKEVLFFSDFQIMLADLNLHKDTWRELWVALSDAEHKVLKKEVFCKTVVNYFFNDWAGGTAAQVGKRASMEIVQTQNKKHPPAVSVSKGSDGAVLAPALSAVVLPSVLPSCMTDEEAAVHFCKWVRYRYRTMNMLWREIANKHGDGKFLLPYVSPEQFQRVLHRSGYGNAAAIVGILVTREVARGKWRVMAARLAAAAGAAPGTTRPTTPSSAAAPGTATTKLTGLMLLELHQSACLLAPYLNQPDDRRLLSATGERQTDQRDEVEMNLITFDFGRWINDPFARHWQSLRDYYSIFCRERAFLPKRLFLRWLQSRQYAGMASGEFVFRFMVTLDANLPGGHVHETMSKQHRPRRMYSPYWSLDDVAQLERFLRLKRGGPAVENIGVATVQPTLSLLESFPGALQWEASVLISLLLKKYASLGMVWRHVLGGCCGPIGFLPFSRGTREFHRNVNISRVYEIFVFFTSHACMGRAGSGGGGLHQLDLAQVEPDVLHQNQNDEDTIIDRLDRDTQFLVQNDSSLDSHTLRNRCAVSTELTARAHIQQRQLDAAVSKPLPRMRLLIRNRSDWNQFSRDFIADNALSYRAFNPRGDATLGIFTKQMWLAYGGKFERVVQDCGSSPGDGKHLGSGGVAMNLDDFFLLCVQLFGPGVIDASYVCEYLLSCLLAGGNRAGGDRCSAITSSSDIALYAAAPAVGGKMSGTPEEEQKNEGAEPIVPVSASDAMAICKYLAGGGGAGANTGRTRHFDPFCYSRSAAHSSDYFTKGFDVTELHSPAMETMKKTYTQWQARYENKAAPAGIMHGAGGNGIKAASYSAVEGGKALDAEVAENEVEIARLSAPAAAPRVSSAEAAEGGPRRRPTARDVLQGAGDGSPGSRDEILRSSAETESRGDSTSSPEQLRSSMLTTEPRRRSIATRWQSKLKIYAPEIGEIAGEVAEPTTSPVVAPRSMGGSIPPVLGNRGRLTIADIRQLSSIAKQNGKTSTSSTPISVQQLRGGGATPGHADGVVDEDHDDSVDVDGNAPPMTFFADTNLDLQDEAGSAAASSGREGSASGLPLNATEEVDHDPEDVGRKAEQDVGLKAEDVGLKAEDVGLKADDVGLKAEDAGLKDEDVDLKAEDVDLKAEDVDLKAEDVDLKAEDVDLKAEDVDFKELGLGVSFSEVASEATQDQGIVDEAAFGVDLDSVLTATAGTGELQGPAALLLPPVASPTEEEMHTIESRYGFVTDGGDFVKFLMQQARMLEKPTCMAALAHYQYFGTPKLRGTTTSTSAAAGPHSLGVPAAQSLTLESLLRRNATSWREEDVEKLVEGGKEFFFAAVKQMCVGAGISPVSRRPTVRNLVTGGYHAPKFGGASNAASVAELQAKAAAELCSTTSGSALKTPKKEKNNEHQLPDEEDDRKNVREQRTDALPALCPVSWEDLVYDVFVTLLPTRTEKPFLQSIEMEHLKLLYGYLPAQRPDLYSNEDLALHLARHLLFQHGVGRLFFKTHASANLYGRAAVLGLWGDLMESEKLYAEEKKRRRGERTMAALRAGAGDPSFQPKLRGGAKKSSSTSSSSSGSGTSSSKSSSSAVTSSSASSSSRPSSSAASGGSHKKKAPVAEGEASPFSSSPNTARSSTDSIPFRKVVPAPSEEQKQKAPAKRITFREFSGILRAYNINTDEVRIFLILWHIERFNRIPSAADIFLEQNVNLNHGDAPVYVKRTKKLDQDFLAMYFAQLTSDGESDAGGPAQESARTSFDPKKEFYITRYALDFLIHRYINSDPFIVEQVDKELQKGRIPLVDAAAADQRGPKEEESGGGTKKSQRGNRGGGGNGNQASDVDELPEEVILYQFVNYHGQGSAWRKLLALTPMSPGISHFRFRTFAAICGYDERYVGRLASLVVTLGGRQWKPFVTHEDLQVCTRVLLNQKMNGLPVGTDVARIETASSAVISKADANKKKSPRASAALAAPTPQTLQQPNFRADFQGYYGTYAKRPTLDTGLKGMTINSNRMFVADSHNRSPVEERASLRSVEVDAKTKTLHGEKPFDLNTFAQRIPGETRVADGFFSYMESNATAATKKKAPTWRAAK